MSNITVSRRTRRRAWFVACAIMVGALPSQLPVGASHMTNTEELEATDNIGAAIAFSKVTFPDGATEAAVGRDDTFPDSLASGLLQASRPLLLTKTDALDDATKAELARLKVTKVYILGGIAAVSDDVKTALEAEGYTTERISGSGRVETAVEVAKAIGPAAESAIVARAAGDAEDESRGFADSLAAGGWAASADMPVLLTDTDSLSEATSDYIKSSSIKTVYVVGGRAAVGDTTMTQLTALGLTVERISGPTRFHTAVAIAVKRGFAAAKDATKVILTEGQDPSAWAAGFSAAALSKKDNAPIVLSVGAEVPEPTTTFLTGEEGDPSAALVCSSSVASESCDAAATALGQVASEAGDGPITFASTTVSRNDYLVGTVKEPNRLNSLSITGCGYTSHKPYVDEQGVFYLMLTEAQGTCSAVFSMDTKDGAKSLTTELSIGDVFTPRSTMQIPELVSVRPVTKTEEGMVLRYLFDEPIAPGDAIDILLFRIQPAVPTKQTSTEPEYAPTSVQRDPRNPSAVLAVFRSAEYHQSTTAYVRGGRTIMGATPANHGKPPTAARGDAYDPDKGELGAVRDIDGYPNATGSFGTRKHDLTATGTEAPELRTVGDYRASDSSVVFTFSEDVKVPSVDSANGCAAGTPGLQSVGRAQLVLENGNIKKSDCNGWSDVPGSPDSLRVTFSGDSLTAAEFESVRRAYVVAKTVEAVTADGQELADGYKADQWNVGLGVVVASGGITPRPDFVNFDNPSGDTTHTVNFVFEEDLDPTHPRDESRFLIVLRSGEVKAATTGSAAYDGARKVSLSFAKSATDVIAYYAIIPDAVKAFNTGLTSFADAIGVTTPDVHLPGRTELPDLTSDGKATYTDADCNVSEPLGGQGYRMLLEFAFDESATAPTTTNGTASLHIVWYTGNPGADTDDNSPRHVALSTPGGNYNYDVSSGKMQARPYASGALPGCGTGSTDPDDPPNAELWNAVAKGRVRFLEVRAGAQNGQGASTSFGYPQGKPISN